MLSSGAMFFSRAPWRPHARGHRVLPRSAQRGLFIFFSRHTTANFGRKFRRARAFFSAIFFPPRHAVFFGDACLRGNFENGGRETFEADDRGSCVEALSCVVSSRFWRYFGEFGSCGHFFSIFFFPRLIKWRETRREGGGLG